MLSKDGCSELEELAKIRRFIRRQPTLESCVTVFSFLWSLVFIQK